MTLIRMKRLFFSLIVLLIAPASAGAAGPQLMLPAACAPGQDCWIVNYTDMDESEGAAADYTCGTATSDGHEGTDFGLRDLKQMKAGVSALAVAPGKVLRVRDGIVDKLPTREEIDDMLKNSKGCGNGILIDHGNGWQSIYCQLKQGSTAVKVGDAVTTGQKLADIGQSGAAEFPHLHFGLFLNGKTIDPFSGTPSAEGCGKSRGSLWSTGIDVDYEPMAVFADGFTAEVPDFVKIRESAVTLETTSPSIDVLAYWVGFYGVKKDDHIVLTITAPDGQVFAAQDIIQEDERGRKYYFVGRRIEDPLLPGVYKGTAVIERAIPGSATEKLRRTSEKIITVLNSAQ